MLCMEISEVVCRRQNGELTVYSKPYTTCLMNPLQKEKNTKICLGSKVFPLAFCGYRLIEGKKVGDKALDVWPPTSLSM